MLNIAPLKISTQYQAAQRVQLLDFLKAELNFNTNATATIRFHRIEILIPNRPLIGLPVYTRSARGSESSVSNQEQNNYASFMEVQCVSSRDSRMIKTMENELTEPVSMYAVSQGLLKLLNLLQSIPMQSEVQNSSGKSELCLDIVILKAMRKPISCESGLAVSRH